MYQSITVGAVAVCATCYGRTTDYEQEVCRRDGQLKHNENYTMTPLTPLWR